MLRYRIDEFQFFNILTHTKLAQSNKGFRASRQTDGTLVYMGFDERLLGWDMQSLEMLSIAASIMYISCKCVDTHIFVALLVLQVELVWEQAFDSCSFECCNISSCSELRNPRPDRKSWSSKPGSPMEPRVPRGATDGHRCSMLSLG